MQVNLVQKRRRVNLFEAVKYQLLHHCYFNNIPISPGQLNCVAKLAILGEQELTSFCNILSEEGIFDSPQSARNAISKIEEKSLIIKVGRNRKQIKVADIKLQTKHPILLDIKMLTDAPVE